MTTPVLSRTVASPATLSVVRGDITLQDTDAIVNAANSSLLGGGGVDGAIHRAGGPAILEECRVIRTHRGNCPAGNAVITGAGRLKARYVIHAVGPVWQGGTTGEDEQLRSAYESSLRLVLEWKCGSVAFPCISTGAYGFPAHRAARIAVETVTGFIAAHGGPGDVRFVVFSDLDCDLYCALLERLPHSPA